MTLWDKAWLAWLVGAAIGTTVTLWIIARRYRTRFVVVPHG
jgi:Na+/phosphate symporter